VGGNEEASRLSGIPVSRTRIMVFAISGLMAALGGVIISSRIMAGAYNVGEGLEFEVIAAVVIGGTSLAGGVGTVVGSMVGAVILSVLDNILGLRNVPSEYQMILKGMLIVGAVLVQRQKR
jgi:ribose transport system permease protein